MRGVLFPLADSLKHAQERIMQKVDHKNGRASLFSRENVKKKRFLGALMSLIALKIRGALFP